MTEIELAKRIRLLEGMLTDAAKLWLAHDGLWFLEVERKYGMESAIELDRNAWKKFTVIEAKRIMKRHKIKPAGGLAALRQALGWRLYAYINKQEIVAEDGSAFTFRMTRCRVQQARERDGRDLFPCKSVGIVEYAEFARTIDPRIRTECLGCPPDQKHPDCYCAWRFSI